MGLDSKHTSIILNIVNIRCSKVLSSFKGTPLRPGRETHFKKILRKPIHLYFLNINVFSVSKLILWYLYMISFDLPTRFKTGMYLLNRVKRLNAFPRSTDIIQVF